LPEAIGLSDELKDVPFACQPIQQGGRHNFIPKNAIPVSKTQIRSDEDMTQTFWIDSPPTPEEYQMEKEIQESILLALITERCAGE